jgi:Plasmid encoded RepA protein
MMSIFDQSAPSPLGTPDQEMYDRIEQLWGREVLDNPRIGFNHYWHTSCGLPTRDPGNIDLWERRDGKLIFTCRNGHAIHPETDEFVLQGYPFGIWPRRMQAVINTLILRSGGDRHIYIGMGFTPFFRKQLGNINMTGGKTGNIARAKIQFMRMNCATYRYYMRDGKVGEMYNPAPMIERCGVYFGDGQDWWPTALIVSAPYRDSICAQGGAVPIDMDAMMQIEGAMEHDIYSWVTRRVFSIPAGKSKFISWGAMKDQFGKSYANIDDFKKAFRSDLRHLKLYIYRDLKMEEVNGGWNLGHSKLAVKQRYWKGFSEPTQQPLAFPEPMPEPVAFDDPYTTANERRRAVKTINIKPRIIALNDKAK